MAAIYNPFNQPADYGADSARLSEIMALQTHRAQPPSDEQLAAIKAAAVLADEGIPSTVTIINYKPSTNG